MYIEFNGMLLNADNVIDFRLDAVDRNGKYPIVADLILGNGGDANLYRELCDSAEAQQIRYQQIKTLVGTVSP